MSEGVLTTEAVQRAIEEILTDGIQMTSAELQEPLAMLRDMYVTAGLVQLWSDRAIEVRWNRETRELMWQRVSC